MRILIVGAGALGGLVGAKLSIGADDVTLLEIDQARARLLDERGLYISEHGEESCVPVRVVSSVEGMDPVDLVIIAVKSYQTDAAVRGVLPVIRPETWMLSMQNGIGNTEEIERVTGSDRILCSVSYHSIEHMGPNRLRYRAGIKPNQIAPHTGKVSPEVEAIGRVFQDAGLDTEIVDNVDRAIWQKLLHNAVVNPVSALTGLTCNELLADEDIQAFMRKLCTETVAVMRARGVPIIDEEDPYRPVIDSQKALGSNRPTMWQDLARGLRTEIDAINGAIVAEAEQHGLSAHLNWGLVRFIHSRERLVLRRRQRAAIVE